MKVTTEAGGVVIALEGVELTDIAALMEAEATARWWDDKDRPPAGSSSISDRERLAQVEAILRDYSQHKEQEARNEKGN